MERGHPEHSEAGREAVLKGQKFTNLDFFFPASETPNKAQQPQRQHPGRCHQQCPQHPQIATIPKTASAPCCPQHEAQGAAEPQGIAGNPPSSHLHVLAGSSLTCCLSRALHRAGQTQKRCQHRRLTHPYRAAGPGDVPRPQGISDFQAPGCRAATARFQWGFGARLPRRRDVAAGCWAAARGCSHDGSIAAGTQRGRSEMQQGKEASCSPQCPPQSRQNAALGFSVAALTLQVTFSKSVSCSDKHPKIPRPPKSWEQQGQGHAAADTAGF